MSNLLTRLNRLEKTSGASNDVHVVLVGYTKNKEKFKLKQEEALGELQKRNGGIVEGLVVFITNYVNNFRWDIL